MNRIKAGGKGGSNDEPDNEEKKDEKVETIEDIFKSMTENSRPPFLQ